MKKFLVSICQEEFLHVVVEAKTASAARKKVEESPADF
jgi:hypothetical protein